MELVTRMFGEAGIGTCIVDEQRSDRTFYNASKGGRQFELVAWFDAEVGFVQNRARSPRRPRRLDPSA
jgi:hypothetical protein